MSPPLFQSLSPSPPCCHSDDEEEDLNKAFDVQGFQQILCPAARSPPEKHRVCDEQDFEGESLKPGFRGREGGFRGSPSSRGEVTVKVLQGHLMVISFRGPLQTSGEFE